MKSTATIATSGLCALCPAASCFAAGVLSAAAELFVDDVNLRQKQGVDYVLHAGRKLDQPVVLPDKSWEGDRLYLNGTVIRDEATGQFRMWYVGGGLAYATSVDGIHWNKPSMNYVLRSGQPTNLLLSGSNLNFMIHDAADPRPEYRYKLVDNISTRGFKAWHSADGLAWTPYSQNPIFEHGSEIANGIRDPKTGRYYVYLRPDAPRPYPAGDHQKRRISVITSDDFINWTAPQLIISPDAVDDAWVTTPNQRTEFYGMSGFDYGNQYLGLLPTFKVTAIYDSPAPGQSQYEGPIDVQLVHSRDGLTWNRTSPRTPVIPNGPDAFDAGAIPSIASRPVIVGDEVWYYYNALNTQHGGLEADKVSTIALAKWRRDGFASLDAGSTGGLVETTEWMTHGDLTQLVVNADASDGSIRVELVDPAGLPLPGYSLADSIVIAGDSVRHQAGWLQHRGLPEEGEFRMRFHLQNASLYSYYTQAIPEPAAFTVVGATFALCRPDRRKAVRR